jgi:hypothetical protein
VLTSRGTAECKIRLRNMAPLFGSGIHLVTNCRRSRLQPREHDSMVACGLSRVRGRRALEASDAKTRSDQRAKYETEERLSSQSILSINPTQWFNASTASNTNTRVLIYPDSRFTTPHAYGRMFTNDQARSKSPSAKMLPSAATAIQ